MPKCLQRYYGAGYLHFITSSCYQRRALLGTSRRRDLFLKVLEQVRRAYGFIVVGYVVMPEHIHLLISEPDRGNPSIVMQVLKQRFARQVLREWRKRGCSQQSSFWEPLAAGHVWQRRFYDFVVWTPRKRLEEIALHASQSGKTGTGAQNRGQTELTPILTMGAGSSFRGFSCPFIR